MFGKEKELESSTTRERSLQRREKIFDSAWMTGPEGCFTNGHTQGILKSEEKNILPCWQLGRRKKTGFKASQADVLQEDLPREKREF